MAIAIRMFKDSSNKNSYTGKYLCEIVLIHLVGITDIEQHL